MFQSWVTGLDFRALSLKCDQGEKVLLQGVGESGDRVETKKKGKQSFGRSGNHAEILL